MLDKAKAELEKAEMKLKDSRLELEKAKSNLEAIQCEIDEDHSDSINGGKLIRKSATIPNSQSKLKDARQQIIKTKKQVSRNEKDVELLHSCWRKQLESVFRIEQKSGSTETIGKKSANSKEESKLRPNKRKEQEGREYLKPFFAVFFFA